MKAVLPSFMTSFAVAVPAYATATSRFTQSIDPIECVYTNG